MTTSGAAIPNFSRSLDRKLARKLYSDDEDQPQSPTKTASTSVTIAPRTSSKNGSNASNASSYSRKQSLPESSHRTKYSKSQSSPIDVSFSLADALFDAKSYKLLTPETYKSQRKEYKTLVDQIASLKNRLSLESKIREAAMDLLRREPSSEIRDQVKSVDKKVDVIATDLYKASKRIWQVEKSLITHNAAVFKASIDTNTQATSKSFMNSEFESLNQKSRESEREVSVLKSTVSRLNSNCDALKSKYEDVLTKYDTVRNERRNVDRQLRDANRTINLLKDQIDQLAADSTTSTLAEQLKLQVATLRAENAALKDDYKMCESQLSQVQENLDESVTAMEEKDRMISDLLFEVEESTNKLEVLTAAAAGSAQAQRPNSARTVLNSNRLRTSVQQTEAAKNLMNFQVKEAVADRDYYKDLLQKETEKVNSLQNDIIVARRKIRDSNDSALVDLWIEIPSVSSLKSKKPTAADTASEFSIINLQEKISVLYSEYKSLKTQNSNTERYLNSAKEEAETSAQSVRVLESKERKLLDDLRQLEDKYSTLEVEYDALKIENKALTDKNSSKEEYKKQLMELENMRLQTLGSSLPRDVTRNNEKRLMVIEKELEFEKQEHENLKVKYQSMQSSYQSQITKIETKLRGETTKASEMRRGDVNAELEDEKRKAKKIIIGLENEIANLEQQLQDSIDSIDKQVSRRVDEIQSSTTAEYERKMAAIEKTLKAQIEVLQDEKQELIESHESHMARMKESFNLEHQREVEDSIQKEIEALTKKHHEEMQNWQSEVEKGVTLLKSQIATCEEEMEAMQLSLDELEQENEKYEQYTQELEEKHTNHTKQLESKLEIQMQQLKSRNTELEETKAVLKEFECVRDELAISEREHMSELSKFESAKIQAEQNLKIHIEKCETLSLQLEAMQQKFLKTQVELEELRKNPGDQVIESALKDSVERLQGSIIELKGQKNKLLEELDDQSYRVNSMENDLNRIKRENEKLVRSSIDFSQERERYENQILSLRNDITTLQNRYQELSLESVGSQTSSSTQSVRSEFRKLVAELRQEYSDQLAKEIESNSKLESQLRALNNKREKLLYNSLDCGVQTSLVWIKGEVAQTVSFV